MSADRAVLSCPLLPCYAGDELSPSAPMPLISLSNIRHAYGTQIVLDGASVTIEPGEIFGLLGPNGAGKTTTLSCVSGLLVPSAGRVRVSGHDVVREGPAARRSLGVVPQEIALYEELSATENLEYWGRVQGLRRPELGRRITATLELAGLLDRAKEPVKRMSGGMQRRLNFACGIVHKPRVLLLDEPTVGVDPQSRVRLLDLVRAEAEAGTCVLYTTHYMEEAESLCHRLAVMDHGRLIAQGSLEELRALHGERALLRLTGSFEPEAARAALLAQPELEIVQLEESLLTLSLRDASSRLPAIFTALSGAGAEVRGTTLTRPSLESLFIQLTGRELRE